MKLSRQSASDVHSGGGIGRKGVRANLLGKRRCHWRAGQLAQYLRGNRRSLPQRAFDLLRQVNGEEITGRIQVIFARLVYDANKSFFLGSFVRQDLINLANDQVLAAFILEANGKPGRGYIFHSKVFSLSLPGLALLRRKQLLLVLLVLE